MLFRKSLILAVAVIGLVFLLSGNVFAQEEEAGMQPKGPSGAHSQAITALAGEGSDYTLGKDDVVEILVRNQPEFSGQFMINPEGNLQYKFVGDILAEGLTKDELKEVLVNELTKYIKIPEVSVTVLAYQSKFVYILGEVRAPGKYPMKGDAVSLRETLIAAGLPTPGAALRRTYVITPAEKRPTHKKVDIYKLLYRGVLEDDITLAPGDLVIVPSTVPTELNRALTTLLSPFSKAASSAALYQELTE